MTTQLIPLTNIICENRARTDLGNIDQLADSMSAHGLIHPLLVTAHAEPGYYVLVAGGRRLAAAKQLGWADLPCVIRESLSEVELAELELEENIRRKDMSWQERCASIAKVHYARQRDAVLASQEWGYEQTGELLGAARSEVHYALVLAQLLAKGDTELSACPNAYTALQLLAARKESEAERSLLSRRVDVPTANGILTVSTKEDPVFNIPLITKRIDVHLADAIDWLSTQPDASLDCIYTDPPYAIDMDNLQQDGVGMNVDTVRAAHYVEENLDLLRRFFPTVATRMKPTAYLVLWCDFVHLDLLRNLGEAAGLRHQRWPLIWVKTHPCQNGAALYNFTKATECAIVLARERATLVKPATTNYWIGPSDKPAHNPTNPFWKPLALHRWLIPHIAAPGNCICDPFAGSGSIPLAAIGLGYDIIAIEKDEKHYLDLCSKLKVL